jgi:uncharacterized protein
MYPDDYIEGVRLFNQGKFWHAHEAWERCWMHCTEPDYTFYKGIIQTAAALYHLYNKDNPRGLYLNWDKSRAKLLEVPSPHKGLDVLRFVAAMDAFVAAYQLGNQTPYPHLELEERRS